MNEANENKKIMAYNIETQLALSHMSKKELAKSIDVPYTTLLTWCQGKAYPRIDKIEKMCFVFGCQKSDLIEDHKSVGVIYEHNSDLNEIMYLYKSMNQQGKDMLLMTARSFAVSYPKKNNLNRMDEAK